MKRNILICILTLLIPLKLLSSTEFSSVYHEYNKNHQFDYILSNSQNYGNYFLFFENKLRKANNKTFNQVNTQQDYLARFGESRGGFQHGVNIRYKHIYDHYPEYHHEGNIITKRYYTGYFLNYSFNDSLRITSEFDINYNNEDNPNIREKEFINKGYSSKITSTWGGYVLGNDLHLNINYNTENKDRNYKNQVDYSLVHTYETGSTQIFNNFYYSQGKDDIYTLIDASYQRSDSQSKDNFQLSTVVDSYVNDMLFVDFNSIITKNSSRLEANKNKNSKELNVDFTSGAYLSLTDWSELFVTGKFASSEKRFSIVSSNRDSETIKTTFGVNLANVYLDSLTVSHSLEKIKTDYPQATSGLDNDFITEVTLLSFRKNFDNRVNFSNYFTYSKWQEIYLSAKLSGNNNVRTSYSYNPTVELLFGDNLVFTQNYTIRADYDDFIYDSFHYNYATTTLYDRFYRQVSAEYKFRYDTSPILTKLSRGSWAIPNNIYRQSDNLNVIASYKFFSNETGDKQSYIYEIRGENKRHEAYVLTEKNIGGLNVQVKPKYEWGQKESFECQSMMTYLYSEYTSISLRAKPKYDFDKHDFVITIDSEINLRF